MLLYTLVPKRLVPVQALSIGQVVLIQVEGGIEDQLVACRSVVVLRPVELVVGPHGVGVAGQDEGEEVLLHHDLPANTSVSNMNVY